MQSIVNFLPKCSSNNAVPASYMGVWQRHLLETSDLKDDSSLVLWMQSRHYHIDVRVPAKCTGFQPANALQDYSDDQLLLLASQQGFAGLTRVTSNSALSSDVCQWQREIDFQPPTDSRDIGKMVFTNANTVIETGVDDNYLEVWRRLDNSQTPCTFNMIAGINQQGLKAPAYLMCAGNYVAYARPRAVSLPKATSFVNAIQKYQPNRALLLDWLDMEISFGEMVDENHWQIKYSTLPFKQNLIIELTSK